MPTLGNICAMCDVRFGIACAMPTQTHGIIDVMVQAQTDIHTEVVTRYMHKNCMSLGHVVPSSVFYYHSLPGWAIEFMLSVLQRTWEFM